MESEMSTEEIKSINERKRVNNVLILSLAPREIEAIKEREQEADERGYQRGKAEQVVLRSQSQHGFLSSSIDEETGTQTDKCVCGAVFSCDMFMVNEALNDHVRQAWAERPLTVEQRTCMERGNLTVEQITSDWEDLKGLEGEALRKRLRDRAHVWRAAAMGLADSVAGNEYKSVCVDIRILCDLIMDKERNCTMEADRLWSAYLTSLEPLCETPEGSAQLYREVGATYAAIVIDRAAKRRMQEDTNHVPTLQEVS